LPYEEDKKVNINSEKSETDGPIENNDLEEGKSAPGPDHADSLVLMHFQTSRLT